MAGMDGFVTISGDPIRPILSASLAAANSLEWSEGFLVPISHSQATSSEVTEEQRDEVFFSAILRVV